MKIAYFIIISYSDINNIINVLQMFAFICVYYYFFYIETLVNCVGQIIIKKGE